MEEKNLIRKQAFETFFKRFPIIILMMAIYLIITIFKKPIRTYYAAFQ